jgi:hypothetical protein
MNTVHIAESYFSKILLTLSASLISQQTSMYKQGKTNTQTNKTKQIQWSLVRKRTVSKELPSLVGEVSANFFG